MNTGLCERCAAAGGAGPLGFKITDVVKTNIATGEVIRDEEGNPIKIFDGTAKIVVPRGWKFRSVSDLETLLDNNGIRSDNPIHGKLVEYWVGFADSADCEKYGIDYSEEARRLETAVAGDVVGICGRCGRVGIIKRAGLSELNERETYVNSVPKEETVSEPVCDVTRFKKEESYGYAPSKIKKRGIAVAVAATAVAALAIAVHNGRK